MIFLMATEARRSREGTSASSMSHPGSSALSDEERFPSCSRVTSVAASSMSVRSTPFSLDERGVRDALRLRVVSGTSRRESGGRSRRWGLGDALDSGVTVLVDDYGERRRDAAIDDSPARGDGSGDSFLGHFGRHIDLDLKPLTRGPVLTGVPKPQVWHTPCGIPDLVAGRPVTLGLGVSGQQGGPHRGDGCGVGRIETELDDADRGRVGVDVVVGGDLGDPSREVDILLGYPFDDALGALRRGRWRRR